MAKNRVKKVIGWLHLWIGLITGVVIIIISITGCIYTFDEEIFDRMHHDMVHVQPQPTTLPLSKLLEIAQHRLGNEKPIDAVEIRGRNYAFVFSATKTNDLDKVNLSAFSQYAYQDEVYINPYTGEILGLVDLRYEFFHVVELLHRQLLLVKPIGSPLVGIFTLIFLLAVLTGLFLWIPKNVKQLKRNLKVKYKANRKRINYDLHNTVGFYVTPIAILFVVTGLVWSFRWWELGMFKIMGEKERPSFFRPLPPMEGKDSTQNNMDMIYTEILSQLEGISWKQIGITFPTEQNKSVLTYVDTNNKRRMGRPVCVGRRPSLDQWAAVGREDAGLEYRSEVS